MVLEHKTKGKCRVPLEHVYCIDLHVHLKIDLIINFKQVDNNNIITLQELGTYNRKRKSSCKPFVRGVCGLVGLLNEATIAAIVIPSTCFGNTIWVGYESVSDGMMLLDDTKGNGVEAYVTVGVRDVA